MKPKRHLLKTAAVIFGILLAVTMTWSFYRDFFNPRRHHYTIDAAADLTEDLAVEFTRMALIDDRKVTAEIQPVPYWPDSQFENPAEAERLFSRNRFDPNSGYILWKVDDSRNHQLWTYLVRLHRRGDHIECRVYRPM